MSTEDDPDNEAFFSRWSRRKRQAALKRDAVVPAAPALPPSQSTATPSVSAPPDPSPAALASETTPVKDEDRDPKRPLSEDDFKDVDFTKLDYQSDYDRFLRSGVPETVRQKALTQLWHSDTLFTQVDPFQDYAGDFTDAAVAVPNGMLKTAYRVGQGFLSDDEARTWDALDKGDIKPEIAALPVLGPGYRVRQATVADVPALAALQAAAIRATAVDAYDAATAESWAAAHSAADLAMRLGGEHTVTDVAISDDTGAITAFVGREARYIAAVHVAPGHFRRGLARRLIAHTIAAFETPDASGVITVDASHLSRPIFERLGFRAVGDTVKSLPDGRALALTSMRRPIVSAATCVLARETADQPAVHALLAASDAYMAALYPSESNHLVDVATLTGSDVVFFVARLDGAAVGCGALILASVPGPAEGEGRYGELKRMWVSPEGRGLKIGVRLLDAFEAAARDRGLMGLRLETGIHQPEAIALYRRAGFIERGPFGAYHHDPLSLFMEKPISARPAA